MENLEENQPVTEESIVPETKPQRQPLYIILLCFFMFVLGGVVVFTYFTFLKPGKVVPQPVVSPSPVPTPIPSPTSEPAIPTDWKTYTNVEHGYTLKYPPTFFYTIWDVSKDPIRAHYISFTPNKYQNIPQPPEVGLVIYNNPEDVPLGEWLTRQTGNQAIFEKVSDLEQTTISGIPALRFVEESPIWSTSAPTVLFPKDGKIIKLFHTEAYTSEDLSQTFNQILSTFRFLD